MSSMTIYDGKSAAAEREAALSKAVGDFNLDNSRISVGAILFSQDAGSMLYSEHKKQAAQRVGINYFLNQFSITDSVEKISQKIRQLNSDPKINGIIIQKPTRSTWLNAQSSQPDDPKAAFNDWWHSLYSQVDPSKDVDGLQPSTIQAIRDNNWEEQGRVLPATVQAVRVVFQHPEVLAVISQPQAKFLILGKSDLVGLPLYYLLKNQGRAVELLGRSELEARTNSGQNLTDADIIVAATGKKHLITGDLIKPGAILIDVGEPNPDVDFQSVSNKASFITPVPGGVGPLTVVCLLENALKLARLQNSGLT